MAASAPIRAHGTVRADCRAYTWRQPDWWLGAASVGAWMALTFMFVAMATGPMHGGHGMHGASPAAGAAAPLASSPAGPGVEHGAGLGLGLGEMSYAALVGSWALMAIAMMLPLVRKQARWLAFRSLRARRQQAVATFTAAFLAVWVVAGALAIALLAPVRGEVAAVAVALLVAALWQCSPPRRRLLRRCAVQRAPAVHGARALADHGRAGLLAGTRCVATCGALMLPMAVAHHPALMAGAAVVLASERRRGPNPDTRGARRLEAWWIGAAAVVAAGLAVAG